MFQEIENYIAKLVVDDARLGASLDKTPVVVQGFPWQRQDEFQVWVYEGATRNMASDYAEGDPAAGTESGTTEYIVLVRVLTVGDVETLSQRLRQLRNNVYDILKEHPGKPAADAGDVRGYWGRAKLGPFAAPGPVRRQDEGQRIVVGAQQQCMIAVDWEDVWTGVA